MLVYQRSGGYLGDGNPDLLGMGGQGRQHRSQGQERSAAPIEIGILTESQGFHKNFSTKNIQKGNTCYGKMWIYGKW